MPADSLPFPVENTPANPYDMSVLDPKGGELIRIVCDGEYRGGELVCLEKQLAEFKEEEDRRLRDE